MRRRRIGRRGPRRKTQWQFALGASNGGPLRMSTRSILSHWAVWPVGTWDESQQTFPGPLVTNPTDLTLVRSINNFAAWIASPESIDLDADSMFSLGFGLIKFVHPDPSLIDSQTFVSGDQVPGVITNPTMDWVWRGVLSNRSFGAVSQQFGLGEQDFASTQSRAMRKLSQNEGLLHTLEFVLWNDLSFADPANERDVSYYFESRMLLKEA